MSARDQMREMLEQLMGAEALGNGTSITDYKDERLCRLFLAGVCPYDLFSNTKCEMGACNKSHSEPMKDQYQQAIKEGKSEGYERELLRFLEKILSDMDRKITRSKERLARDQQYDVDLAGKAKAVEDVSEEMGKALAEAERLGSEGQVEESMKLMQKVEELKAKRTQLETSYREKLPTGLQQQKLRVCEICGSFLSILDNDRRLADHFGGKLHMGFVKVREMIDELRRQVEMLRQSSPRRDRDRRHSRDQSNDRSRRYRSPDRNRDRRRDRSRDRDRGGDYRRRDRRDRRDDSRDRRRRRSRSRDRYSRERSDSR